MGVIQTPTTDDRALWDLWLSQYRLPVVLAADELGIFDLLAVTPADLEHIGAHAQLSSRAVEALMAALAAQGFVALHRGRFHPTDVARNYLLKESEFYWVKRLRGLGAVEVALENLLQMLRTDNLGAEDRITRNWERGQLTPEAARAGNARMHSHSFPAALGLARTGNFEGVQRLLDVAGGSGCFSIALASQHPELRCTVAELPVVVPDTQTYIERYGCQGRVDVHAMNMFDDAWPTGYDAILFSNVLHDWDDARRNDLVESSFSALPSGGRIYVHEMLLNDTHDGPLEAALFSIVMLTTRGKQFSAAELEAMLARVGFGDVQVRHTYGYYSLMSATKPS
jgi:acetylserotonin N-methyltransferase